MRPDAKESALSKQYPHDYCILAQEISVINPVDSLSFLELDLLNVLRTRHL